MSWLQDHLDTFVAPRVDLSAYQKRGKFISPEQMTVVKNAWRAAKHNARGRTILLMGRDVWTFEVLARREGYPTIFDPSCSRQTCYHSRFKRYDSRHVLLDTGFIGSIAKALRVDCMLLSADRLGGAKDKQIFPSLKGARSLALFLESLPKYWKSAIVSDGLIIQELSQANEFAAAALVTQEVYTDSSPRNINHRSPLGENEYASNVKNSMLIAKWL